jgi:uncharacterized protein YndB with AHSA1/START domain
MLEINRVFAAPRRAVFAALTDPRQLERWWGPAGFRAPRVEFDPRPGARYRIEMRPAGGDSFQLTGELREVVPPARLAMTFEWEPPDPDDVETLATLDLRDLGQSTEVALVQGPFMTDARRALHENGWTEAFEKLERLLASQR